MLQERRSVGVMHLPLSPSGDLLFRTSPAALQIIFWGVVIDLLCEEERV